MTSVHPRVARTIKRIIWFLPLRRLRKNTVRTIASIEDILPTIERQWLTAKDFGLTKYSRLYNSMSFLLLLHYDFAILAYNHAAEVDERKQNLYARQLCLLIHEALEDIPTVFGNPFRNAAVSLPNGQTHVSAISSVLKTLGDIRRTNERPIADVRNFVAAHRDHDALKQLEIMRNINNLWLMSISEKFTEFLGKMANALTPLLYEMGDKTTIFKHILGRA